jgi:hypothetical protein
MITRRKHRRRRRDTEIRRKLELWLVIYSTCPKLQQGYSLKLQKLKVFATVVESIAVFDDLRSLDRQRVNNPLIMRISPLFLPRSTVCFTININSDRGLLSSKDTVSEEPPSMKKGPQTLSVIILLYHPNPSNSTVGINVSDGLSIIEIRDVTGRLLNHFDVNLYSTYDFTDYSGEKLKSGLYFFSAKDVYGNKMTKRVTLIR